MNENERKKRTAPAGLVEHQVRHTIKFVLCPGYVFSQNDMDSHFISARKLADLYRVPFNECVVKPDINDPRSKGWKPPATATVELRPRCDGNYIMVINT